MCVYFFCHWVFAHLIYSGRHWAFFAATISSPCWTKNCCSIFSFPAQGHIVFAQTSSTLQNPELRRLASSLPARALQSKAPRTIDQYSRSFQKFRVWASGFPEITVLPTRPLDVALYLEHLIQSDASSSVLHSASCGISWANKLYGFPDPCQDPLVKNILEAGARISAKPVVKKEPITPEMISSICSKYASPSANLSSLRIAALFITAYCAFLRFDELAKLRCCDVNFHNSDYVKITIVSSKTDVYRDGSSVLLARTGTVTCPYTILSRYFHLAALNCYSSDFVFRNLVYHKSSRSYSLGSRPISYSRARELLLNSLVELGFPKSSYGLHSLRSGGASAAANAGISDRLFKRHGRWKSDRAKGGYVKDNINSLLSVSRSLGL